MRALFLGLSLVILVCSARSDAEVVWVDAAGNVISPMIIARFGRQFAFVNIYIDDAGLHWLLDEEAGTVRDAGTVSRTFAEPDCEGPAYIWDPQIMFPRWVFTIARLTRRYVRPDALRPCRVALYSIDNGRECTNVNFGTMDVIPVDFLAIVDAVPPDLGAVPPLHLERK